ncbi:MAG: family 20 glycosylhydrolase [Pseudomonadota bacterium]|nr:family 20 glycosylhydrolase [Pseudomonadota bacterium]
MRSVASSRILLALFAGVLILAGLLPVYAAPAPLLIPAPASLKIGRGEFLLDARVVIQVRAADAEMRSAGAYLSDLIWHTYGLRLAVRAGRGPGATIELRRSPRTGKPESYRIHASSRRVRIAAHSHEGLLHGTRTLWQLIARSADQGTLAIPAVRIDDAPRFIWRGIMLDSARHYQTPQFIRDYIDWMALHKLNVLHWHLTDDQAWRLQIQKYPKLTDVGAWRVPAGRAAGADIDSATGMPRHYGGFYTQQQVREIVAHAKTRGVRIVPEIEMPGHATAALVAYPQFAASARPATIVPADWGIYSHVYGVEEPTFEFLEDVLDEVMAMFPGEWIHVGGDEVEKTQWAQSPQAQTRMRELGITEPAGLQGYFTQRIGRYLQAHGRRLVGWDEILTPGLARNAIVMSWRGIDGALAATAQGYDSVLSPFPTLYFDNRQGTTADEPPGRVRLISLEDVYRFDPLPDALNTQQAKHLLGIQGAVWTEHIRTEARVAWMSFPRAAAVAELGWSQPERRDWNDFLRRLPAQFARYDALHIPHADSAFAVDVKAREQLEPHQVQLTLSTQTGAGAIRYTLDGSEPDAQSSLYREPLSLELPIDLRVASYWDTQRLSRTRHHPLSRAQMKHRSSAELKLCSDNIALAMEDDAPLTGDRAVFHLDIQNPCWIYEQANLDRVERIVAAVGDVPFNFQIGETVHKIILAKPETPNGELLVHLDRCDGPLIARIALPSNANQLAVTELAAATITAAPGRHDLCFRFAQHGIDPMRTLDWVQLVDRPSAAEERQ